MKMSLSWRLFIGFFAVIIMTCALSTFVGLRLIDRTIMDRIQDKVRLDLRSARSIYQEEAANIREIVRISALSFFDKTRRYVEKCELGELLERIAEREAIDILALADTKGDVLCRFKDPNKTLGTPLSRELVKRVLQKKTAVVFTLIISQEDLMNENPDIARRAFIEIIRPPYLKSEIQSSVSSGMAIVAAAPVLDDRDYLLGVLYGGRLINNSSSLVDRIMEKVYGNEIFDGREVGLATVFLSEIRISTSLKQKNGKRAIGTVTSDDVYDQVLKQGRSWISRPFAVNRQYVTAYEPIRDISDRIVGMLSIGVLDDRFRGIQEKALWSYLLITLAALGLSLLLCYFFIRSTLKPIRSLVLATERLAEGNLEEQVHLYNSPPEIATLGKSFNTMAQSIQKRDKELRFRAQEEVMKSERLAMIGQLAAGVAHEINNPLGSILLFNRLVLKKCAEGTLMHQNLERVEREVKRCQNIVQGLLEFARQRETNAEIANLNVLLDKTVALFENQPMFHNVELVRQYQDLPGVIVDPAQIQQVFVNIIMNALHAIEEKGKLTITSRFLKEADTIEIGFADTGCGMTKEVLDRIFEPFYTTKGVGDGTGLGLSISYGIIQKHGGSINVSSRKGEGSLFVITLPRQEGSE